jgi:hypothetical protein
MKGIEVNNWQRDETIAPLVRAAFPGYKRKSVAIDAASTVTVYNLNWDGGSRNEYAAVELATARKLGDLARFAMMWPGHNYAEGKSLPVPEGTVVVRGGTFCGKQSRLTLYVNPADMPKHLTIEP